MASKLSFYKESCNGHYVFFHWAVYLCLNMNAEFYWESRASGPCFQTNVSSYEYGRISEVALDMSNSTTHRIK